MSTPDLEETQRVSDRTMRRLDVLFSPNRASAGSASTFIPKGASYPAARRKSDVLTENFRREIDRRAGYGAMRAVKSALVYAAPDATGRRPSSHARGCVRPAMCGTMALNCELAVHRACRWTRDLCAALPGSGLLARCGADHGGDRCGLSLMVAQWRLRERESALGVL